MRIPENHVGVRILQLYDGGALRNAQGQTVRGLNNTLLVAPDEGLHADEELLNKPGAVCVAEVCVACPSFSRFPEVLAIGEHIVGCELFHLDEVPVGAVVAIKQNEFDAETPLYTDEVGPVHLVPYWALLCLIRTGEPLVPVGGYTLSTAIMPPRAEKDLVQGKIEWVMKDALGLVVETNVQPLTGQGRLAYLGRALRGQPLPFYPGQRVLYHRWTSGPRYRIRGGDYYAVRHPDLSAVVDEHEEVLSLGESRYSRTIKRPIRGN